MSQVRSVRSLKRWKGELLGDRILRPVGGLEAEFAVIVDGQSVRPEQLFGDPRGFIASPLLHRTGRSFQLVNGAAVYFDTGVIEVATPVMELERGCFGRLARSIDDAVALVRQGLDQWEVRTGRRVRLQGFSTHYNVSVDDRAGEWPRSKDLAWLLVHLLPAPVMLLATNRASTGVGVRPRPHRVEVTADYSPDPARLAATGAVIAGVVRAASSWRSLDLSGLARRGIPVFGNFRPVKHTSRRGWLARFDCYSRSPFACDVNVRDWPTTRGLLSLRQIALRVLDAFDPSIHKVADPHSYALAWAIASGGERSWLEAEARPPAYDDVGRATPSSEALRTLGLSRYERVVLNTMRRRLLTLGNERYVPVGMRGWSRVVFRRERDGARTELPLDTLVRYLDRWAA